MDTNQPKLEQLCYISGDTAYFTTLPLKKQWGDDWDDAPTMSSSNWHQNNLLVLASLKLTSTQHKYTYIISQHTRIMETLPKSTKKNSQTLNSLLADSLAKLSQLLESEEDLKTLEELCSFTLPESPKKSNHVFYSLRTSKACYLTTKGVHSRLSYERWMKSGTMLNGMCLTVKTTEYHKTGKECSLLDILEEQVDQKYFLSEKQTQKILGTSGKICRTQ